jgi:hypothetical protein
MTRPKWAGQALRIEDINTSGGMDLALRALSDFHKQGARFPIIKGPQWVKQGTELADRIIQDFKRGRLSRPAAVLSRQFLNRMYELMQLVRRAHRDGLEKTIPFYSPPMEQLPTAEQMKQFKKTLLRLGKLLH